MSDAADIKVLKAALWELQIEKQSAEAERDYFQAELEQAAERQRELIECIIHHQSCRYCAENGCSSCGDCTANAILAQSRGEEMTPEQANEIITLRQRVSHLEAELEERKRLYDLCGEALKCPCPKCGYVATILAQAEVKK